MVDVDVTVILKPSIITYNYQLLQDMLPIASRYVAENVIPNLTNRFFSYVKKKKKKVSLVLWLSKREIFYFFYFLKKKKS
jgi:hypothetical protein